MRSPFADWGGQGRTVALLAACLAVATTNNVLLLSVAALTGHMLAPDKSLATLPIAMQWLGTAGATFAASFIMRRLGRRLGFVVGVGVGLTGAVVSMAAIYTSSFALLCLGIGLVGAYNGFNGFYRFAAADVVAESHRSRAISLTLSGGVIAAVVGPAIARASVDLLSPYTYMGAFAAMLGLGTLVLAILTFVHIPPPPAADIAGPQRSLGEIARQPVFMVAALGAIIGYGVMVLLMSVTPLAMAGSGHGFGDSALAIQWHVLGMYAPAFVTGHLIRRFGVLEIMLTGVVLFVASVGVAASGTSVANFWIALFLLGAGWNFCFVAGTTLLTEAYTPAEKAKTQALNDFLTFGAAGLGTLFAGTMLHRFGWVALNLAALPIILAVGAGILVLLLRRRQPAAVAGGGARLK